MRACAILRCVRVRLSRAHRRLTHPASQILASRQLVITMPEIVAISANVSTSLNAH